ncbi:MAG TPA: anti-sigma factor antagonist [Pseudomonas xinjiangensis]|uniref:Anti-sigma factor antagonist n=2 Tax=root TaxID=1 RepID=A0A7V1BNX4_9GAMM|nr:anti-sigma factor antagonist [Halopseudomonas xinjiangensis]HEC46836.1 anti-sigma factor antagonist [Halopseudomonas xinjiangensis]
MTARVVDAGNGVLNMEGVLDFASVVPLREDLERAVESSQGNIILDLGGVTRANSVGLSLILIVARALASRGDRFHIRNVPSGLQSIATVCELDEWLASVTAPPSAG